MLLTVLIVISSTLVKAYIENPLDRKKVECRPEQVHISYGDTLTEMVIVWSTLTNCTPEVQYGTDPWNLNLVTPGHTEFFEDLAGFGVPFLHRAVLQNLEPSFTYFYSVVGDSVSSEPFFFRTPTFGSDWSPNFIVYGDLGIHSDNIPKLITEARKGTYTAILHVGDFAYNMEYRISNEDLAKPPEITESNDDNSTSNITETVHSTPQPLTTPRINAAEVGDTFMRSIEGMAAFVPYMTSPGNHEIDNDTFNQYRYRFSMPNTDWPMHINQLWYSMDIGPVHFLSYSSEVFFTSGGKFIKSQRDWIIADLKAANQNRQRCPWVIALGHRPMYCSNDDGDDCSLPISLVREGLEELFYEYGVDIVLQAHEHSYERLWPVYKGVVLSKNYTNPPAPVQIVTGAAGSKYGVDKMKPVEQVWSAFRMDDRAYNSYGRLEVKNSTHVYWEQIGIEHMDVLDAVWIVQESHGPFKQADLQPDVKQKIDEQIKHEEEVKKQKGNDKTGWGMPTGYPSNPEETNTESSASIWTQNKTRIAIGVSFGAFIVLFLLVVCIVHRCRRKPKSYRRWETLDYGKKFYSTVKSDEKDTDDFEVEVNDGTTKLLTSNGID